MNHFLSKIKQDVISHFNEIEKKNDTLAAVVRDIDSLRYNIVGIGDQFDRVSDTIDQNSWNNFKIIHLIFPLCFGISAFFLLTIVLFLHFRNDIVSLVIDFLK